MTTRVIKNEGGVPPEVGAMTSAIIDVIDDHEVEAVLSAIVTVLMNIIMDMPQETQKETVLVIASAMLGVASKDHCDTCDERVKYGGVH